MNKKQIPLCRTTEWNFLYNRMKYKKAVSVIRHSFKVVKLHGHNIFDRYITNSIYKVFHLTFNTVSFLNGR